MDAFVIGFCVSAGWLVPYLAYYAIKRFLSAPFTFGD